MTNNATGERKKHRELINHVQAINAIQLNTTKARALSGEIVPAGISLIAVLGFKASNFASSQRLNAIAALLAKTIHNITSDKRIRIS